MDLGQAQSVTRLLRLAAEDVPEGDYLALLRRKLGDHAVDHRTHLLRLEPLRRPFVGRTRPAARVQGVILPEEPFGLDRGLVEDGRERDRPRLALATRLRR